MPTYTFTVSGVARRLKLGFEIIEAANGRNRLSCAIDSLDGTVRPPIGAELTLDEDGIRIFGGTIEAPHEGGAGGLGIVPITTQISALDYNAYPERKYVNYTFAAGTLKSILQSLVTTFLSAVGLTLDPLQEDGPTLSALPAFFVRADDLLNQLSTLSGWIWNVDYSKQLRMRAPTTTIAPFDVTTASRYALGDVTVEPSWEDYGNRVHLLAGDGLHDVADVFAGNGTTSTFTLRYSVSATRGYVDNSGVTETLGTGATWTLDPAAGTITRVSPPAAGAVITINYTAQFPVWVMAEAPGGIPTPPGLWERLVRQPDVFDLTTAQALATAYAGQMSVTQETIQYRTQQTGIHPGMTQRITIAARHFDAVCLITEVRIRNANTGKADRFVTAIKGTTFTGSWRDMIRSWNSDATGVSGSQVLIPGGGGTTIGPGTPGKLAKWLSASTIGDSLIYESGSAVTVSGSVTATSFSGSGAGLTSLPSSSLSGTIPVATLPGFTGQVTAAPGSNNLAIASNVITNAMIAPTAAIAWSKINLTGGALGDFGGNLQWNQLPSGYGVWNGQPEITGVVRLRSDIMPTTGNVVSLGNATLPFRKAWISELPSVTFTQQTQLLFGGYSTIAKQAGVLGADAPPATPIDFGQTMTPGDYVVIRQDHPSFVGPNPVTEYMQVGTLVSGTTYNVTRDLLGSIGPDPTWPKGTPYMVLGHQYDGRIDLLAFDGKPRTVYSTLGTGSPVPGDQVRAVMGNLSGYYGYTAGSGPSGSDPFGVALGDPAKAWVKIDDTNGVTLGYAGNTTVKISPTGASTFEAGISMGASGSVTAGNVVLNASGLYIAPVTSVSAFGNTNAGRWATDTTYRTAIWRSDDASAGEEWHFDHFMPGSPAVPLAFTSLITKSYAAGGTTTYGATTIRSRTLDTTSMLQLWTSTSSSQDAFAWFWSAIGGGASGRLMLGVGTASNMIGSGNAPTITTGLECFGANVTITGNLQTPRITQPLSQYVYPGSASGLADYQTSWYLAAHSMYNGLYTNGGLSVASHIWSGGNVYPTTAVLQQNSGGANGYYGWLNDGDTWIDNFPANAIRVICGGVVITQFGTGSYMTP